MSEHTVNNEILFPRFYESQPEWRVVSIYLAVNENCGILAWEGEGKFQRQGELTSYCPFPCEVRVQDLVYGHSSHILYSFGDAIRLSPSGGLEVVYLFMVIGRTGTIFKSRTFNPWKFKGFGYRGRWNDCWFDTAEKAHEVVWCKFFSWLV